MCHLHLSNHMLAQVKSFKKYFQEPHVQEISVPCQSGTACLHLFKLSVCASYFTVLMLAVRFLSYKMNLSPFLPKMLDPRDIDFTERQNWLPRLRELSS